MRSFCEVDMSTIILSDRCDLFLSAYTLLFLLFCLVLRHTNTINSYGAEAGNMVLANLGCNKTTSPAGAKSIQWFYIFTHIAEQTLHNRMY
jgi:hypothetical protein